MSRQLLVFHKNKKTDQYHLEFQTLDTHTQFTPLHAIIIERFLNPKRVVYPLTPTSHYYYLDPERLECELKKLFSNLENKIEWTNACISVFRYYLSQDSVIAIPFQEIFLSTGASPSLYRAGHDIITESLTDYQTLTGKFSQQLTRCLIHYFYPPPSRRPNSAPNLLSHYRHYIQTIAHPETHKIFDQPLNSLYFFNDLFPLQYIFHPKSKHSIELNTSELPRNEYHQYIDFSKAKDHLEIVMGFNHCSDSALFEFFYTTIAQQLHNHPAHFSPAHLILILKNPDYKEVESREHLLQFLINFVQGTPLKLDVFLIHSESDLHYTLNELKPDAMYLQENFAPLVDGIGYYVSAPALFYPFMCMKKHPTQSLPQQLLQISPTTQSTTQAQYRIQANTTHTHRRSKFIRDKTAAIQISSEQSLAQTHSQTFTQEVAETIQDTLSHTQQQAQDFDYFSYLYFTDDFYKIVQQLKDYHTTPRLSSDDLISFKLSGYSKFHLQRIQLLHQHDDTFYAKLACLILNCGYQHTPSGLKAIYIPQYSSSECVWGHDTSYESRFLYAGYQILERGYHQFTRFGTRITDKSFGFFRIEKDECIISNHPEFFNHFHHIHEPRLKFLRLNIQWGRPYLLNILSPKLLLRQPNIDPHEPVYQDALAILQVLLLETWSPQEFQAYQIKFIEFTQHHLSLTPLQQQTLQEFTNRFDQDNPEYFQILVHLLLDDTNKLPMFIELIQFLKSIGLEQHFYHLYFKFTNNLFLLQDLFIYKFLTPGFQHPAHPFFHFDLTSFPKLTESQNLAPPYQFYYHSLEYFSHSQIEIDLTVIRLLKKFHQEIYALIFQYCHEHEANSQILMRRFYRQLLAPTGFNLPIGLSPLKFTQHIKTIVYNASTHGTLEEQLQNIAHLSLTSMDAPFAIQHEHFKIVSHDMELHCGALDPHSKSYTVSREQLERFLQHYETTSPRFTPQLFRYLGTEIQRESLFYYRQLLKTTRDDNEDIQALLELFSGYYILQSTGPMFQNKISIEEILKGFYTFYGDHPLLTLLDPAPLQQLLENQWQRISLIPTQPPEQETQLWTFWFKKNPKFLQDPRPESCPPILYFKFKPETLDTFVHHHQAEILALIPKLNPDSDFFQAWVNAYIHHHAYAPETQNALRILPALYSTRFEFKDFIQNFTQIHHFFKLYQQLCQYPLSPEFHKILQEFLQHRPPMDITEAGQILCLVLNGLDQQLSPDTVTMFIQTWDKFKSLHHHPSLTLIIKTFSRYPHLKLDIIFQWLQIFISESPELIEHHLPLLIEILLDPQGEQLLTQTLTKEQYADIFDIIIHGNHHSNCLQCLNTILNSDNPADLHDLKRLCLKISKIQASYLFDFLPQLLQQPDFRFQVLHDMTPDALQDLSMLATTYQYPINALWAIMQQPHPEQHTTTILQTIYQIKTERFSYQWPEVKARIHKLQSKFGLPIKKQVYQRLKQDFQKIMQFISSTTVLIEDDIPYAVHQLKPQHFQILYQNIRAAAKNSNQYCLLIALAAEALFRTRGKFPRDTQIIAVLMSLYYPQYNLIQEVKTGEGKSIIAAFTAFIHHADMYAVDILTENQTLAKHLQQHFFKFFHYFGIPCHHSTLSLSSQRDEYQDQGINFSSASEFALFRLQMQIQNRPLPGKRCLIWDEIDAALHSSVDFRISCVLDPLFLETQMWKNLYQIMVKFIQEEHIFKQNFCSPKDDVHNFRSYFLLKSKQEKSLQFLDKLKDSDIDMLIESTLLALDLQPDVDYMLVNKSENNTTFSYAAPYLKHSKRPDPRLSFSQAVQQILHARLELESPAQFKFKDEPISSTITVMNAQNLFEDYLNPQGRVIGLTGTTGSDIEAQEFYQEYGLIILQYPSYYPSLSTDLGQRYCADLADQQQQIFNFINTMKPDNTQPILIIANSPAETASLYRYLTQQSSWSIQTYSGYSYASQEEEQIILKAGQDHMITVANESLARGTDITPKHQQGLLVINACTDLTLADLIQIHGRAARNGRPGQFISFVNQQKIASPSDASTPPEQYWLRHQSLFSQQQYQERQHKKLLYRARHFFETQYLLRVKNVADPILTRQLGEGRQLVPTKIFMQDLSEFTTFAEKTFNRLCQEESPLTPTFRLKFLTALHQEYLSMLKKWVQPHALDSFDIIEPSIPLNIFQHIESDTLAQIQISDLQALSSNLSQLWLELGNQNIYHGFQLFEQIHALYVKLQDEGKRPFTIFIEVLLSLNVVNHESILQSSQETEEVILSVCQYLHELPVIGRLLPKDKIIDAIKQYFTETHQHIQDKDWNKLHLPDLSLSKISNVISMLSSAASILGVAFSGPLPFIINQIIIPVLLKAITSFAKKFFKEAKAVKIIQSFGSISSDLTACLQAILSPPSGQKLTVGYYLDQCNPLIKNETFRYLFITLLEWKEQTQVTQKITVLDSLFEYLENYRDLELQNLFKLNHLIEIFAKITQDQSVQQPLKELGLQSLCRLGTTLKPNIIALIQQLPPEQIITFVKTMAHPQFTHFLQKLPTDYNFQDLIHWLGTSVEDLPKTIQASFLALQDYQENRERQRADQCRIIQNLHQDFTPSIDKIERELKQYDRCPQTLPEFLQTTTPLMTFIKEHWKTGSIILGLGVLTSLNIAYFSYQLLLTSIFILASLSYKTLKKHYQQLQPTPNPIYVLPSPS